MRKTVLVTGGAGYIGSHTCKELHRVGYTPVTLDNLVNGHEWAVKWGPFFKADLSDKSALAECFHKYAPEAVIHFAAYAYVNESVANPAKYYQNNVLCTLNLLDAMRENDCGKIVFSSSCAVYGAPATMPILESQVCSPVNPYGNSKLFGEKILEDYGRAYGIRHVSLRYFNAAGADPDCQIGEAHAPESHLIPLALQAALPGAAPLTVYGTDWNTEDGTCVRDYIHVRDLSLAHLAALNYLSETRSAVFNLGSGVGHSVQSILDAVQTVVGNRVVWRAGPRRPGDLPCLVADWTRAKKYLEWSPKYSELEQIVEHAWNWMRKNKKVAP